MNDVMQGRWTLLHVIGLVVWQKHVKSLSLKFHSKDTEQSCRELLGCRMLHLVQGKSARLMKQCYAEWCMDVTSEPLVSTEAQTWCLQEDTTKTAACSFLSHPRSTFSFESVVPISQVFYFLGSLKPTWQNQIL